MNPGMCARGGGNAGESISKDEVGIKVSNDVSQNVDVIIGSSNTPYVRVPPRELLDAAKGQEGLETFQSRTNAGE